MFNAFYKALVMYARTIIKDHDEAEDIVQQVFVSLWEKRRSIEVHTSLKAFLYKAVHNACLNRIRQLALRLDHAAEVKLQAPVMTAPVALQQKELQQRIDHALTILPEQCARIFKMSRFEQLRYQQIADQLGLSVKTVENQMGKALKIMRQELHEYLPMFLLILSLRHLA